MVTVLLIRFTTGYQGYKRNERPRSYAISEATPTSVFCTRFFFFFSFFFYTRRIGPRFFHYCCFQNSFIFDALNYFLEDEGKNLIVTTRNRNCAILSNRNWSLFFCFFCFFLLVKLREGEREREKDRTIYLPTIICSWIFRIINDFINYDKTQSLLRRVLRRSSGYKFRETQSGKRRAYLAQ